MMLLTWSQTKLSQWRSIWKRSPNANGDYITLETPQVNQVFFRVVAGHSKAGGPFIEIQAPGNYESQNSQDSEAVGVDGSQVSEF